MCCSSLGGRLTETCIVVAGPVSREILVLETGYDRLATFIEGRHDDSHALSNITETSSSWLHLDRTQDTPTSSILLQLVPVPVPVSHELSTTNASFPVASAHSQWTDAAFTPRIGLLLSAGVGRNKGHVTR